MPYDGICFFEPLGELVGVMSWDWGGGCGLSISDGGWPKANRSRRSRELGGVVDWAAVAEFAVGPHGVVLDPEVLYDDAGLGQRPHLLPIEALIAEAGVERFHKTILPRTGRGDVDRLNILLR